jgi:hypothetical protein
VGTVSGNFGPKLSHFRTGKKTGSGLEKEEISGSEREPALCCKKEPVSMPKGKVFLYFEVDNLTRYCLFFTE